MIDFNNKGFFKLKQNDEYAERVRSLLLDGEQVIDAYKSMRDGVVFTTQRIIAVNVQGLTGSKKDFTSLPYKTSSPIRWKRPAPSTWTRYWKSISRRWAR